VTEQHARPGELHGGWPGHHARAPVPGNAELGPGRWPGAGRDHERVTRQAAGGPRAEHLDEDAAEPDGHGAEQDAGAGHCR